MKAGKISYAGVGVAVGGVIGFIGIMVGWFTYSFPLANGVATVTLHGTADWTGGVAMAAAFGAFAFGGAYLLIQDAKLRKLTSVLMGVSSAFLLMFSIYGYTRISDAVGVPAAVFSSGAGKGIVISFVGGVVALVGSLLASRESTESVEVEPQPQAAGVAEA
ncbi:MAG: hypothetical protein ABI869_05850 [Actinomycetota bacterium]